MKSGCRIPPPAGGKAGPPAIAGAQIHNCLHDFVKHALLQQLVPPGATVCDLYSGHGADTPKWAQAQIGRYVGVDLTASALEEAREHWDALSRPYLADFCELDPCMEDLQSHLHHMGLPADIVCCMGHLQDCFLSEDVVRRLLQNVSSILKPGGYFFGITADSSTLWSKYQKAVEGAHRAGALKANGHLPCVISDYYVISFEDDGFMTFGTKYMLQLPDGLPSQSQNLVHFPSLIRLAEDVGLEYIEIQNLFDFYEDYRILFLDALQRTCGNLLDSRGRLPPFACDVLGLYTTFIFKKEEHMEPESVMFPPFAEDEYQSRQWAGNMDMNDESIAGKNMEERIVTPSQGNKHLVSWEQQSIGHSQEFDVLRSDYHPKAQTPNMSRMMPPSAHNIQIREQGSDGLGFTVQRMPLDYKNPKEEDNCMDYEPFHNCEEQTEAKLSYGQVQNVYKRKRSMRSSRTSMQFPNASSMEEDCKEQLNHNNQNLFSETDRNEQLFHFCDNQRKQLELSERLDSNTRSDMMNKSFGYSDKVQYSGREEPHTSQSMFLPKVFNEKHEEVDVLENKSLPQVFDEGPVTSERKSLPQVFDKGPDVIDRSLNCSFDKIQLLDCKEPHMSNNVSSSQAFNEKHEGDESLAGHTSQIDTPISDMQEDQVGVSYKAILRKDSDEVDAVSVVQGNYADAQALKGIAEEEAEDLVCFDSNKKDDLIDMLLPASSRKHEHSTKFDNLPAFQHGSPNSKNLVVQQSQCSKQQPSDIDKDTFCDQASHSTDMRQLTEQEYGYERDCVTIHESQALYLLEQRQEDALCTDIYPSRSTDLQIREDHIFNQERPLTSIDQLGMSSEAVSLQEENRHVSLNESVDNTSNSRLDSS